MTTETKRKFEKLGYSMWKTKGSKGEWYYITAHMNPMAGKVDSYDPYVGVNIEGPLYLLICSCKDFTIGVASREQNCFVNPCKHIRDFDESEVDIEILERGSQG